jgi:signal peptidase II
MKKISKLAKTTKRLDDIWKFFAPIVLLCFGLDQWSKAWASGNLAPGERVDFGFNLSHNSQLVFGLHMPLWGTYVLTVGILILGFYVVVKNCLWKHKNHLFPLALILAGALGNIVDRVRLGYVVDFIQIYWWPTFNVADMCIVSGVIILSWQVMISEDALEDL